MKETQQTWQLNGTINPGLDTGSVRNSVSSVKFPKGDSYAKELPEDATAHATYFGVKGDDVCNFLSNGSIQRHKKENKYGKSLTLPSLGED